MKRIHVPCKFCNTKQLLLCLSLLFLPFLSGCKQENAPAVPAIPPAPGVTENLVSLPEAPEPVSSLTIARMENNRYVTETIEAYNQLHPELPLESQWYYDNEGELKLALAAGSGPDLMSLEMFDYEIYAEKGVFVDLNTYLDAEPALRDALVPSILKAFQWPDGALYQIAPSYQLQSLYTVPGLVDPALPWNLDTVEGWMEEHPDALFTTDVSSPSELMELLLTGYMEELVDFQAMTCDFTSGLFERILTDCQDWSKRPWNYGALDAGAFTSGALLTSCFQLADFSGYKDAARMGLIQSLGYPRKTSPVYWHALSFVLRSAPEQVGRMPPGNF